MIVVKNIYKSFSEPVLTNISFTIDNGEFAVILGKSGVGKSVLLKIIVGLLKPDKGEVEIDNMKIHSASEKDIFEFRKSIGFVFQSAALFDSMNVFENVALPLIEHYKLSKKEIREKVFKALSLVDLEDAAYLFPAELSGGMKKRVSIARAIVHEPEYIFYDEPTTGLDPQTVEKLIEVIRRIWKEKNITSVAVTHDFYFTKNLATRIIWLSEGKVKFNGTVEEFKYLNEKEVKAYFVLVGE
jgi:phospholipid/cholesterol/gamma-HCH transport system ATP-binding protein